jgi:small conductance mechanosensitive channel
VKDVINGFFLIMENQYAVGDYVTINTCTGKVEEIGMRIMKIRDDTGRLHILSNGDISQVTNMSRGLLSGVIELGAARDSDLLFIEQIVNREGEKLFQTKSDLCLAEAPKFSGVGALEFDHVIIKALVKVSDPTKLGIAQTALRSAYLKAIAEKPELLPE